jgi:hypothetical protein
VPDYDICYREQDGTLVEKFSVRCATPMQAKILAHAMKTRPFSEIEVWDGEALVYARPEFPQSRVRHVSEVAWRGAA